MMPHPFSDEKPAAADLTLCQAQAMVDNWIRTYGVRYFSELTNMAVLTEEVGELARIMARRYGDQSFKAGEPTDPADEMADVLRRNIEKKTARDNKRHIDNPKLYDNPHTDNHE